MTEDFDCVIVGSGPGGYVAAIRASQLGMRTALVERDSAVGGRCLHWACIPAKTVLRSADVVSEVAMASDFGVRTSKPVVDFGVVSARRQGVITMLASGVSNLLQKNKVEVVKGTASLDADANVVIGERTLTPGAAVVLASGSVRRSIAGLQFGGRIVGTEEAWSFTNLPRSLAVVGAGASGVEIASAYARLGAEVSLFEVADRLLPGEDSDIAAIAARSFERQGITAHAAARITDVRQGDTSVSIGHGHNGHVEAEWLVVATGRAPDVDSLGLAEAGVSLGDHGLINVDGQLRTSVPKVYAIGDLVPGPALAHKASEEGVVAVEAAAGMRPEPIDYLGIPRATFCSPTIGSFGLTETSARHQGYDVVIGRAPYASVGAAAVYGERDGLVKIVGEATYGTILGAHIVGARATELIQQLADLRALEGGFIDLARIVHGHPTLSETILEAARAADGWSIHA